MANFFVSKVLFAKFSIGTNSGIQAYRLNPSPCMETFLLLYEIRHGLLSQVLLQFPKIMLSCQLSYKGTE